MDRRLLGPLGVRLALAFTLVALVAVGIVVALTVATTEGAVTNLVHHQHTGVAGSVGDALSAAYVDSRGWTDADLTAATAIARHAGARLTVRDASGDRVGSAASLGKSPEGAPLEVDVEAGGRVVGKATLLFPAEGLPAAERRLRDALLGSVLTSAALAGLVALGAGLAIARLITRPLVRLRDATRALEAGDAQSRVGGHGAPGELGEVAEAFDRMAATLSREDQLRRALVADVAHELRTPVTILRAHTEQMLDDATSETGRRVPPGGVAQLASLHDEVLRLARLVEDLETLSAAEAAGLSLHRRCLDLADVAERALDLLAPQFEAADVGVAHDLSPSLGDGDPGRLRQVVVNLLSNALKFTPVGGRVAVTVDVDGSLVRLAVADSGPGIPEEDLPHVFERFWRGARDQSASGSGIGLAVVAALVEAHGGRVLVRSEEGTGTEFTVWLPRSTGPLPDDPAGG